jgi:hypothetical protein
MPLIDQNDLAVGIDPPDDDGTVAAAMLLSETEEAFG